MNFYITPLRMSDTDIALRVDQFTDVELKALKILFENHSFLRITIHGESRSRNLVLDSKSNSPSRSINKSLIS